MQASQVRLPFFSHTLGLLALRFSTTYGDFLRSDYFGWCVDSGSLGEIDYSHSWGFQRGDEKESSFLVLLVTESFVDVGRKK